MLSKRQESLNQESWPLISSVFLRFCKLLIFRTKQLSEQGYEEKPFCRGFSSLFFLSHFGCAGFSLQNIWNRTLALALESRFSKPGPLGKSMADFRMGEWRWGKLLWQRHRASGEIQREPERNECWWACTHGLTSHVCQASYYDLSLHCLKASKCP